MKRTTKRGIVTLLLSLAMIITVLSSIGVTAYCASGSDSYSSLTAEIDGKIADKKYQTETGGFITGKTIVKEGVVNSNFDKLTPKAKQQCLADMVQITDDKIEKDNSKGANSVNSVSTDTKNDWLTQLQACDGVGSKLMTTILSNTKPDYVTANKIWEPFSGPVGTALGLGAIVIMALLGLTIVLDLAYMVLPMARGFLEGENGENAASKNKSKLISHEAINAVEVAEGKGEGKSTGKVALGIYLKRRIVMLLVLGVCLLYLVSGQIFTLVGMFLDLLSGFIGF